MTPFRFDGMTPFRFDKKVKELGTAQGLRERRLRYILASLAGGALIVPLATTVRLQGGGVLQIAVFFAIPLFAYVVVLRSRFWSLLTGLALIAITAWSSIGYAKAL